MPPGKMPEAKYKASIVWAFPKKTIKMICQRSQRLRVIFFMHLISHFSVIWAGVCVLDFLAGSMWSVGLCQAANTQ